jgi:hypothetical protein
LTLSVVITPLASGNDCLPKEPPPLSVPCAAATPIANAVQPNSIEHIPKGFEVAMVLFYLWGIPNPIIEEHRQKTTRSVQETRPDPAQDSLSWMC